MDDMTFLTASNIAVAAGLTIPPLVALYFLKLKRQVRVVPSTLLWKRTVEDLRVNAPFQRLRSSLLLLLQLLVLVFVAVALGRPMFQTAAIHRDTVILLIDRSASMGVVEEDGRTRLEIAKEHARRTIDNLGDDARAMVIAFCDRATVVSSFDRDHDAIKKRIDEIEPTQSTTRIGEAITLAEAYAQQIIIGGQEAGRDVAPESAVSPASLMIFTDGRISDAADASLQKFALDRVTIDRIGTRSDNLGITAMQARRHYEKPEILQVTATVRNFGPAPVSVDLTLSFDGRAVDVKTVTLGPARNDDGSTNATVPTRRRNSNRSQQTVAFDETEFGVAGLVDVVARIADALDADDRAWVVVESPRRASVLLVADDNPFLESALSALPIDLVKMAPALYELADDSVIKDGDRSAFDVVIFDRHSTARLPVGSYVFWGAVPKIDGVGVRGVVRNGLIFNWDDTHPLLRHVSVESITAYEWLDLTLPTDATVLIEGANSPVLAYFARGPSQYLVNAFSVIVEDDQGVLRMNTSFSASADFVLFNQNVVQFLAANVTTRGRQSLAPGDPISLPVPSSVASVNVARPDGKTDTVPTDHQQTLRYARTRAVGVYRLTPDVYGRNAFAVNLFSPQESNVGPASSLRLGMEQVQARASATAENQPAWPYFLLGALALLLLEWIVYNRRVFV